MCSWAETVLQSQPCSHALSSKPLLQSGCSDEALAHRSVPSLREIQETLVEVGDKPETFVGSREWIGTFEACIVLDHLFGVSRCTYPR